MKKVLSLLLAVTMIASMVTAFAELAYTDKATISLSEVNGAKVADEEFTVDVKLNSAADLLLGGFRIIVTADAGLTLTDITHKGFLAAGGNATKNVEKGFGSWAGANGTTNGQDEVVFELKFKVATVEASGTKTITVTPDTDGNTFDSNMDDVYIAPATATVNLVKTFDVATFEAIADQTAGLGDKVADVKAALADLDITVKGADAADTATLKAVDWTCAELTTENIMEAKDYTFKGTLVGTEIVRVPEDKKTVTVMVKVGKITLTNDMPAFEAPELGIKQDEEAEAPITAAAALAHEEVVEVLPTTVMISNNGLFEEEATITWAPADASATLDLKKRTEDEATNKIAIVGTVTPSAEGNYTGTATVNAEIIVVPAQIANSEIAVSGANLLTAPQVTITVPATEVKDANVIAVTITCGGEVIDEAFEAAKADFDIDEEAGTATITVKFAEKYNKLGFENGDEIEVGATLNGAALADAEGNPLAIEKTVKKPSTGGGGSGVPASTSKPGTETPGTETPGTETPGTETPGTETPGTETPGTETPGTDAPVVEGPFADVAADNWAAPYIATLKEAGVVSGSGDGTFAPDADITRAEFTKMVVGVMGLEATATEVAFEDCTAEDWFTPYVAAAVEAGLVNGVSETEFAPNATITREQAFAIVGRAIGAEATAEITFADAADIDEYAAPYVALLVELGIINGYEDGTIRPDANITRAEAAKILASFVGDEAAEEVVEEATEEVVEEATEEVVVEEATEEVVDEK